MSQQIYLDHNATTPVLTEVLEALRPFWAESYGNPSSLHQAGQEAAKAVREARREVASLLGARDESEIVFTSGGTESNNAVFRSALWTEKKKRRIVTTAVEHSSVLKVMKALQEEGAEMIYCPVDEKGNLDRDRLRSVVTGDTALVSVMSANNETGVLFPVEEIGREVRAKGVLFHVDAVQAVGKIPISLKNSAIDFLSLSAHKFGGPKGAGALYVRKGVGFRPFCFGGSQERGRRAGTENVPGIVGLGRAAKQLKKDFGERNRKVGELRDDFERKVFAAIPDVKTNGDPTNRLPNTSNLAFEGVDSEALLILLDQEGVYASSGSACLSGAPEPSHVLTAMGFSKERARSSVRFSFGSGNTAEEINVVVSVLEELVGRLREIEFEGQHPHSVV
jgi:cysteine desulfurase